MSSSLFFQCSSGLHSKPDRRSQRMPFNPMLHVSFSRNKIKLSCVASNISLRVDKGNKTKRNFVVYSHVEPLNPSPSGAPSDGSWKNWVLGIAIAVILSLFTGELGPLSLLKNQFDTRLQWVEDIVEAIEKVARKIEKMAEPIIDKLPDGPLKKALSRVEHIAEKTADGAEKVDDLIDEFQDEEKKLEVCIRSTEENKAEELAEQQKVEESAEEKKADESVEEESSDDQSSEEEEDHK